MEGASYMVLSREDMAALEVVVERMINARDIRTYTYQTKNGGTVTITPPQEEARNDSEEK